MVWTVNGLCGLCFHGSTRSLDREAWEARRYARSVPCVVGGLKGETLRMHVTNWQRWLC